MALTKKSVCMSFAEVGLFQKSVDFIPGEFSRSLLMQWHHLGENKHLEETNREREPRALRLLVFLFSRCFLWVPVFCCPLPVGKNKKLEPFVLRKILYFTQHPIGVQSRGLKPHSLGHLPCGLVGCEILVTTLASGSSPAEVS